MRFLCGWIALTGLSAFVLVHGSGIPQAVSFEDTDPRYQKFGGLIHVEAPEDTSDVASYEVRWGSGPSTVLSGSETIADYEVSEGSSAGDPTCDDFGLGTCDQISIDATSDGGYLVSRGDTGYENNEGASINFHGPGTLSLTYLDTESNFDFLYMPDGQGMSGVIYSPMTFDISSGTDNYIISWQSDGSVVRSGWTVEFMPLSATSSVTVGLGFNVAAPFGATHILAASIDGNGQRSAWVGMELQDNFKISPPDDVTLQDTDNSLGQIEGILTVQPSAQQATFCMLSLHSECVDVAWRPGASEPFVGCNEELAACSTTPFITWDDLDMSEESSLRSCDYTCDHLMAPSSASLRYDVFWGIKAWESSRKLTVCDADAFALDMGGYSMTGGCENEHWGNMDYNQFPSFVEGPYGPALRFGDDPESNFQAWIFYTDYLNSSVTVMAMIKLDSSYEMSASGSTFMSIGKNELLVGEGFTALPFLQVGLIPGPGGYKVSCTDYESRTCTTVGLVAADAWTQVACARGENGIKVFIDGFMDADCVATQESVFSNDGDWVLRLGGLGPRHFIEEQFVGDIDQVGVFAHLMEASTVLALGQVSRGEALMSIESGTSSVVSAMLNRVSVPPRATELIVVPVGSGEFESNDVGIDDNGNTSFLAIPIPDAGTPTEVPESIEFEDMDPASGSINGTLVLGRAASEMFVNKYIVYWGESATTKLSEGLALTLEKQIYYGQVYWDGFDANGDWVEAWGMGSELGIMLSDISIPNGASHLLAFSAFGSMESTNFVSVEVFDYAPPVGQAQSVVFEDTDINFNIVAGVITIARAADEVVGIDYVIYWAGSDGIIGDMIAEITPSGDGDLEHILAASQRPFNASSTFVVFLRSDSGISDTGAYSDPILDYNEATVPSGIVFRDTDSSAEEIVANITLIRALVEEEILGYAFWWVDSSDTDIGQDAAAFLPLSGQGAAADSYQVVLRDSYGDGWNGNAYTIRDSGGNLMAQGTMEYGSELTETFSFPIGTYEITISLGQWAEEISWEILACYPRGCQTVADGGAYDSAIFEVAGGGASISWPVVENVVVSGTRLMFQMPGTIPASAAKIKALSILGSQEGADVTTLPRSVSVSANVVDWSPPSTVPSGVSFTDTATASGVLSGTLSFTPSDPETGVESYVVRWGPRVDMEAYCHDAVGWYDSIGRSCQTYLSDELCTTSGDYGSGWTGNMGNFEAYRDFLGYGLTATEACCACGGSVSPPGGDWTGGDDWMYSTTPHPMSGMLPGSTWCTDIPDWSSDAGNCVAWQESGWCSTLGIGAEANSGEIDGSSVPYAAYDACCACGGGLAEDVFLMSTGDDSSLIGTISVGDSTGNTREFALDEVEIPFGAGSLVIFPASQDGEAPYGIVKTFVDVASATISGASFWDANIQEGMYTGHLTFSVDLSEEAIEGYGVFFATDSGRIPDMSPIEIVHRQMLERQTNTVPLPSFDAAFLNEKSITHIVVLPIFDSTIGDEGAAVEIIDSALFFGSAGAVIFEDTDNDAGEIGGSVTIEAGSSDIVSYSVYWGEGPHQKYIGGVQGMLGETFELEDLVASLSEVDFDTAPRIHAEMLEFLSVEMPPDAGCIDTDAGAVDLDGYGCFAYWEEICVDDDASDDFDPVDMCCICGGGENVGRVAARASGGYVVRQAGQYSFSIWVSGFEFRLKVGGEVVLEGGSSSLEWREWSTSVELGSGVADLECEFLSAANYEDWRAIALEYSGPDTGFQKVMDFVPFRVNFSHHDALGSVTASAGSSVTLAISENTAVPPNATHLLVVPIDGDGSESLNTSGVSLRDMAIPSMSATFVRLNDTDPRCGILTGTLEIGQPSDSPFITQFNMYLGVSATDKWAPAELRRLSDGRGFPFERSMEKTPRTLRSGTRPQCVSRLCPINFEDLGAGNWRVSRNNYGNSEQASVLVPGPGFVDFEYFVTEQNFDFLTFLGEANSGSLDIAGFEVPEEGITMTWSSDFSVTTSGWSFLYSAHASDFVDDSITDAAYIGSVMFSPGVPALAVDIDNMRLSELPSTDVSHILVFAASETGESLGPADVSLFSADFCPVASWPSSVTFEDADLRANIIGGTLEIGPALSEEGISAYVIYVGSSPEHKLLVSGQPLFVATVEVDGTGDIRTVEVEGVYIPTNLEHDLFLLAYSVSTSGAESAACFAEPLVDRAVPQAVPASVEFNDTNPEPESISGRIIIGRAINEVEERISSYNIYFADARSAKLEDTPMVGSASSSANGDSSADVVGGVRTCGVKGPDNSPLNTVAIPTGLWKPNIVNGQDATPCEYRWQVSLRSMSGFSFCGGTLISPRWVVTAAHCVDSGDSFKIVAGDYDKSSSSDQYEIERYVVQVIRHPEYVDQAHDIALVELEEEIGENECVGYACLPEEEVEPGTMCFISGWGTLQAGGSTPDLLQEAQVEALGSCSAYSSYDPFSMLCAQGRNDMDEVTDACQGDSGGPLVCPGSDGRYELHGATSFGRGCAEAAFPGVWARVSSYLDWLEQHTGVTSTVIAPVVFDVESQAIPEGAARFIVYAAYGDTEALVGVSDRIVDFAPPQNGPLSIHFVDADPTRNEISGRITVVCAPDEAGIEGYDVSWATFYSTVNTTLRGPLVSLPTCLSAGNVGPGQAARTNVSIVLPPQTAVPASVNRLMARSYSSSGLSIVSVLVAINDWRVEHLAGGITFNDQDAGFGVVGGLIEIEGAADESDIDGYHIYWGTGTACNRYSAVPLMTVAASGSALTEPTCTGRSCGVVDIDETTSGVFTVARSDYSDSESADISVQGPARLEFTSFSLESGYDFLTVVGVDELTGSSLPGPIDLPAGVSRIEWRSDHSVTSDGWSFTVSASGTGGSTYERDLAYGTPLLQARSLLAISFGDNAERDGCASTPILDFSPPIEVPAAVFFDDQDSAVNYISGVFVLRRAQVPGRTDRFNVYTSSDGVRKLVTSRLFSVSPPAAGQLTEHIVPQGTTIPDDANFLLIFAENSNGEAASGYVLALYDWAPPIMLPVSVTFEDRDPRAGIVAGALIVEDAEVDPLHIGFSVYSSDAAGNSNDWLGELGRGNRPECSGTACNSVLVEAHSSGGWTVSRGSNGYGDNEQAYVSIGGPGVLSFLHFNTEAGYDYVEVSGQRFSGNMVPEQINIPEGQHVLSWISDGSVTKAEGGWTARMVTNGRSTLEIGPTNASHVLVVPFGNGGEMDDGYIAALTDWAPPSSTPPSVEFTDTDLGIGRVSGTVLVHRASDDWDAGVRGYEAFWASGLSKDEILQSLGQVDLANPNTAGTVSIEVPARNIPAGATHIQAFVVGVDGSIGANSSVTPLNDATGLTLNENEISVVLTTGTIAEYSLTISNSHTESVNIEAQLLFVAESADLGPMAPIASNSMATLPGAEWASESSSNRSRLVYRGGWSGDSSKKPPKAHKGHGRCLYKWNAAHHPGRKLADRRLKDKYGVKKVKEFDHVGVGYVESAPGQSVAELCAKMMEDPEMEFAEEDMIIMPVGMSNRHFDLFHEVKTGVIGDIPRKDHLVTPGTCKMSSQCRAQTQTSGQARNVFNNAQRPQDPDIPEQWGLDNIKAFEAWQLHRGDRSQFVVAVIDTGVDYLHEDLVNRMWENPGEIPGNGIDDDGNGFIDDVNGWDFANDDNDPSDSDGHGTHCAGVIGAEANNSKGGAGVSFGARIMALKALDPGGYASDLIASIDYAVMMGARVSSNSWGSSAPSSGIQAAIEASALGGHLFIAAAGNDGLEGGSYPCANPTDNIICVASLDVDNALSSFSNYGDRSVDIGAPGRDILSTMTGGDYEYLSGTSMATPFVSGAAALVWDLVPSLTYHEVKSILLNSGDVTASLQGKTTSGKRLDLLAAVQQAMPYLWLAFADGMQPVVTVEAGGSAPINMVFGNEQMALPLGEYRAFLQLRSRTERVLTRNVPIHLAIHEYVDVPSQGPSAASFQDTHGGLETLAGVLTIARASDVYEAESISQYRVYWGSSATSKLSASPSSLQAALSSGTMFKDEFTFFDHSFWERPSASQEAAFDYGSGFIRFSGGFEDAHLRFNRRPTPPFSLKGKVRASAGTFAPAVIEIGGVPSSPVRLMRPSGAGVQVAQVGGFKTVVLADGTMYSVPCMPSGWVEYEVQVHADSISVHDSFGCQDITVETQMGSDLQVIIGAGASSASSVLMASDWDFFEVSGEQYVSYTVPEGTAIPVGATHLLVLAANIVGEQDTSQAVSVAISDLYVPVAAVAPTSLIASDATTSSLSLSWQATDLHDCSFTQYEVRAAVQDSSDWFEPDGCTSITNVATTQCTATGLESNTAYLFKVRASCIRSEASGEYSDVSPLTSTLPVPANAPSQVVSRLPTYETMLVSWRTNSLNDCEFVENLVQAKVAGGSWFRPQGCQVLPSPFSYMCTATGLDVETSYMFRVTTKCSDPRATSSASQESAALSTLAENIDADIEVRRMSVMRQEVAIDMDYETLSRNTVFVDGLASDYAERYGVAREDVVVEVSQVMSAEEASPSSRRLAQSNAKVEIFVTAEEDQLQRASLDVTQAQELVSTLVKESTGEEPSIFVSSAATFLSATAPGSVVAEVVDADLGEATVSWSGHSMNNCDFLGYQVYAIANGDDAAKFAPSGCEGIYDLGTTSCQALSLSLASKYEFTVTVLCQNEALESPESAKSSLISFTRSCDAPVVENAASSGACVEGNTLTAGCTPTCATGFYPSVGFLSCTDGQLSPPVFACDPYSGGEDAPEMLSATLDNEFTQIRIQFSAPTFVCASIPCAAEGAVAMPCGETIVEATLESFGEAAACEWVADRTVLLVTMGEGATIRVGDKINTLGSVLYGALPTSTSFASAPESEVVLEKGSHDASLNFDLVSEIAQVTTCDGAVFTSSVLSGGFGRTPSVAWSIGQETPTNIAEFLQGTLELVGDSTELRLSGTDLHRAALQAQVSGEWTLEIEAVATNWVGGQGMSSLSISVTTSAFPAPAAFGDTPLTKIAARKDSIEMAVRIEASMPACWFGYDGIALTDFPEVAVTWEHKTSDSQWLSVIDLGFVDTSPQARVLRLAPYSLEAGSSAEFRAVVAYGSQSDSTTIAFVVNISVPGPVVAELVGPEKASTCAFTLDAAASYDPEAAPGEEDLLFEWSCESASACPNALPADPSSTSLVVLPENALAAGTYTFSVKVSRASDSSEANANTDTVVVQVVDSALPPARILPVPWSETGRVSVQDSMVKVEAMVEAGGDCPLPDGWAFGWVIVDEATGLGVSALEATQVTVDSGIRIRSTPFTGLLSDSGLAVAGSYSFALLRGTTQADLEALLSSAVAPTFGSIGQSEGYVGKTGAFMVDGVPTGGGAMVDPQIGEEVRTRFNGETVDWSDEDDAADLRYAFYRFPLENTELSEATDGSGSVVATPSFDGLDIEWLDESSAKYWTRKGGLELRAWSHSADAELGVFPIGSYVVVARAMDSIGGKGAAVMVGPLVNQAVDLSAADVASALQNSLSSGDPDMILNSVSSLSGATIVDPEQQKAKAETLLNAMDGAVDIQDSSNDGVQKTAMVMKSLVSSSGDALGVEQLSKASSIVSKSLDALVQATPGEGISKGTGDALLSSVVAVAQGFSSVSQGGSDGEENGADLAESGHMSLVAKVGSAVAQGLEDGESQELDARDESGKGAAMTLQKDSVSSGVSSDSLEIPASALEADAGRRLESCGSVSVQITEWVESNPLFGYLPEGVGLNDHIDASTNVSTVGIELCGTPITTAVAFTLKLSLPTEVPEGDGSFEWNPVCAMFDSATKSWTTVDVEIVSRDEQKNEVVCSSGRGAGTYAAVYGPVAALTTTAEPSATLQSVSKIQAQERDIAISSSAPLLGTCGLLFVHLATHILTRA